MYRFSILLCSAHKNTYNVWRRRRTKDSYIWIHYKMINKFRFCQLKMEEAIWMIRLFVTLSFSRHLYNLTDFYISFWKILLWTPVIEICPFPVLGYKSTCIESLRAKQIPPLTKTNPFVLGTFCKSWYLMRSSLVLHEILWYCVLYSLLSDFEYVNDQFAV